MSRSRTPSVSENKEVTESATNDKFTALKVMPTSEADMAQLRNSSYIFVKEADSPWKMFYTVHKFGKKTLEPRPITQFAGLLEALPLTVEELIGETRAREKVNKVIEQQGREALLLEVFKEIVSSEAIFHENMKKFSETVDSAKKMKGGKTEQYIAPYRALVDDPFTGLAETLRESKEPTAKEKARVLITGFLSKIYSEEFKTLLIVCENAALQQPDALDWFRKNPLTGLNDGNPQAKSSGDFFLIQPVQRPMRYVLLIADLIKRLNKAFPDMEAEKQKLDEALEFVETRVSKINKIKEANELAEFSVNKNSNLRAVLRAAGQVAEGLEKSADAEFKRGDFSERYRLFAAEMDVALRRICEPEDNYNLHLMNVAPDFELTDENFRRIQTAKGKHPILVKKNNEIIFFGQVDGLNWRQTKLNDGAFAGLDWPALGSSQPLMFKRPEISAEMYAALRKGHLPPDIDAVQAVGSLREPFISAYIDAYLEQGSDDSLLKVLRQFIRDTDSEILKIQVGKPPKNLHGVLFGLRPCETNTKDEEFDESVFWEAKSSAHIESLVNRIFNKVKESLQRPVTDEKRKLFSSGLDIVIKMASTMNDGSPRLDEGTLKIWNDLCESAKLELKISANKQEQERLKGSYEAQVKSPNVKWILSEHYVEFSTELTKAYAKDGIPGQFKENMRNFDELWKAAELEPEARQRAMTAALTSRATYADLMRASVTRREIKEPEQARAAALEVKSNEALRTGYLTLLHQMYVDAYIDDRTKGRKGFSIKSGTIKGPYLEGLEKMMVVIESDLISRGQKGLIVADWEGLQAFQKEAKKEAVIFKSLASRPEVLQATLQHLCSRVEKTIRESQSEISRLEAEILNLKSQEQGASLEKSLLGRDSPNYKADKAKLTEDIASFEKQKKVKEKEKEEMTEACVAAIVNSYKVLERMEVEKEKEKQTVKKAWSLITAGSEYRDEFEKIHQMINLEKIKESQATKALTAGRASLFSDPRRASVSITSREREVSRAESKRDNSVSQREDSFFELPPKSEVSQTVKSPVGDNDSDQSSSSPRKSPSMRSTGSSSSNTG